MGAVSVYDSMEAASLGSAMHPSRPLCVCALLFFAFSKTPRSKDADTGPISLALTMTWPLATNSAVWPAQPIAPCLSLSFERTEICMNQKEKEEHDTTGFLKEA